MRYEIVEVAPPMLPPFTNLRQWHVIDTHKKNIVVVIAWTKEGAEEEKKRLNKDSV